MRSLSSSGSGAASIHRHVAVCPFPQTSHINHMFRLSCKIAASSPGLLVTFFAPDPSVAALKVADKDEGLIRVRFLASGLPAGAPPPANPKVAMRSFLEAAPGSLRKCVEDAEEEAGVKIGFVVVDCMMTFAGREIAEERGVKWVAMWVSSASALLAHLHTDLLLKALGGPQVTGTEAQKDETVDKYIPELPPIPMADLPNEILAVDGPVGRALHHMSHHLPEASAVLMINAIASLEPTVADALNSAYPNKFLFGGRSSSALPHGPPHDPEGCLPWLDTHPPASVFYISFGSSLPPPLEEFPSLSEALEAAGVPFLWSLPRKFASFLPEGFEERTVAAGAGKFVAWAPQTHVLGHAATGAQLTHGGWSSVVEGIAAGVPMMCRPSRIADLAFNARMVYDVLGIGVEIEGGKLTKAATEAALGKLLLGEEGRKARERIKVLKRLAEEGDAAAVSNLEKFIHTVAH